MEESAQLVQTLQTLQAVVKPVVQALPVEVEVSGGSGQQRAVWTVVVLLDS